MRLFKRSTYPRTVEKTVAFDGTAGNGAVGTVALFTLTGRVRVKHVSGFITETLAGATATVSVGTSSQTADLLPLATATDLAINEWWSSASAGKAGVDDVVLEKLISQSVILTVGTAAVTNGTIVVAIEYVPLTSDGLLVPA